MSNSDLIAICAVVVAVLALFATTWQAVLARQHSRLSVRPHLDVIETRRSNEPLSLEISNSGLGPAILDDIQITISGNAHKALDRSYGHAFVAAVSHFTENCSFKTIEPGTPLLAGQGIELFSMVVDTNNDEKLVASMRFINEFEISLVYHSMYGENFSLTRVAKK